MNRPSEGKRTGLARALSKLGFCSRSEAWKLIQAGRVRLNNVICRDPERPVFPDHDKIVVDDAAVASAKKIYLMLNKPRGLVTTTSDEKGRETVYKCFANQNLPRIVPVGRLDQASEGLLLFTSDTKWADQLTDPKRHVDKTYHVQIDQLATEDLLAALQRGRDVDGDFLAVKTVTVLREGEKNCWLQIVLDEGKNRHIRRLLGAFGIAVLRLIRVSVGPLSLGNLPKGSFRQLTDREVQSLAGAQ